MTIELDTDLEYFQGAEYIEDPIREILNWVADEVEAEEYEGDLKDWEGNTVGHWKFD